MAALNRFDCIGRLTKNPEVKTSQSGKDRTLLTIAQDKTWTDANGEKQKKGLFFQFVAYGKVGEILAKYTTKGSKIYLSASLEPYTAENSDGSKTYGISFIIQDFEFLESKKPTGDGGATQKDADEVFDTPFDE